MSKRILVVLGHPAKERLCGALAECYVKGAETAGYEVRLLALGNITFDPVLHNGFAAIQELEPDLADAQSSISWAEHLVFVYPLWWGAMPALLKGFIDRVFLPGFAFNYRKGSPLWDRLLSGRTAHLIVTMDTPPWYYRWVYRMPGHNQMKRNILEFSGIKPVAVSSFGPIRGSTPEQREKWIAQVSAFGRHA